MLGTIRFIRKYLRHMRGRATIHTIIILLLIDTILNNLKIRIISLVKITISFSHILL